MCRSRNPSWWQRRTRFERRLSLFATVFVFVTIGLAIALAALIYRVNATETIDMNEKGWWLSQCHAHRILIVCLVLLVEATPSAAAFTSTVVPANTDPICDSEGCVLACE